MAKRHSAVLVLLAALAPVVAAAATTEVPPGTALQTAVDAAAPGDTLILSPGVYPGAVVIDKPLRISGKGAAFIDPLGAAVGVEIASDDVRIVVRKFKKGQGWPGLVIGLDSSCPTEALLRVDGRSGIVVRDVHGPDECVTEPTMGFDIANVTDSRFKGIRANAQDTGIRVRQLVERANVTFSYPSVVAGVGILFENIAPGVRRGGARLKIGHVGAFPTAGPALRFVSADGIIVSGGSIFGDVEFDAQSDNNLVRGVGVAGGTLSDAGSGNCVINNEGLPDSCP
jgi:hypothetical protein